MVLSRVLVQPTHFLPGTSAKLRSVRPEKLADIRARLVS